MNCFYFCYLRRVFPEVAPGYLANLIPKDAPADPDEWENIMGDIETVIMPGVGKHYIFILFIMHLLANSSINASIFTVIDEFTKFLFHSI